MDRTFQARVDLGYWMLTAVTSILMFYTFWVHEAVIAVVLALAVILEIEAVVHTHYVVTADGKLIASGGRFARCREADISRVELVRCTRSLTFGQPVLSVKVLELVWRKGNRKIRLYVSPRNEEAFIACLQKHNPSIEVV